jgi:hypothetical protein
MTVQDGFVAEDRHLDAATEATAPPEPRLLFAPAT